MQYIYFIDIVIFSLLKMKENLYSVKTVNRSSRASQGAETATQNVFFILFCFVFWNSGLLVLSAHYQLFVCDGIT